MEITLMLVVVAIPLLGNGANLDQFLAWSDWSLETLAKVTASIVNSGKIEVDDEISS